MSQRDKWSSRYDHKFKNPTRLRRRANQVQKRLEHPRAGGRTALADAVDLKSRDQLASQQGMVAGVERGQVRILWKDGLYPAKLSKELAARGTTLAVGDRVNFVLEDCADAMVTEIQPRMTKLARVRGDRTRRSEFSREEAILAANVGVAVIVASVAMPPFHPRLVDRYLVICEYGGIQPILCLNKCDLSEETPDLSIYKHLGLPILGTSTQTGQGVDELRELLHGKLSVFTGHSGVGKSSLINSLLGENRLRVGTVRNADGRGRHTTSSSNLLQFDEQSYVIDTPGIRALGLWKIDARTLQFYFPEFDPYRAHCKFVDCTHTHEPECAVKIAVVEGLISHQRYDSYTRMMEED